MDSLGMEWGRKVKTVIKLTWDDAYRLALKYYQEYNNLKVKRNFKTKDGVSYAEDGFSLGRWICRQQVNRKKGKLMQEQIALLDKIGMVWSVYDTYKTWDEAYDILVRYYNEYGNIDVSVEYRTEDGYDLHSFIYQNKRKYQKGRLEQEQVMKLERLGMVWEIGANNARKKK